VIDRERMRRLLPLLAIVVPIVLVAGAATLLADVAAARLAIRTIQSLAGEWWAPPLFVALYALFAILLLPVGVLSAGAALAWGWKIGGTIELLTLTVVSLVPFLLGRRGLKRVAAENLPAIDSPFVLLLLRIVPLVPYVALNYIAGATKIRVRDYVATTFFGSIPSVYLFAYFVDTMAAGAIGAATQARIVGVCIGVAVAAIALRFAGLRVRRWWEGRRVRAEGEGEAEG
jgi:uncharacterized membrane protein YdjX (TVP38/TMEM64 family)